MKNKYLFMIKSLINTMVKLFPVELIPNIRPKTREGKAFNKAMLKCIKGANVNAQTADLRNFMAFMEIVRTAGLFLMEKDSYYRGYVKLFLDAIRERNEN